MASNNSFKVAILHAFFKNKGGAEKLIFDIRNHYKADLFTGAIQFDSFNLSKNDSFSKQLFDPNYKLTYFHKDGKIPGIYHLKRILFFWFSSKVKLLNNYNIVIFSGNIFQVPKRLNNPKLKKVLYCHTPPRIFTDQLQSLLSSRPKWQRPIFKFLAYLVMKQYKSDLKQMDLIITNSENTRARLLKFTGFDSKVLLPCIDTSRFKFINQQDFYLSYARIEEVKRIKLIIDAFSQMPDKKLIICSIGPLKDWVENEIKTKNLKNIVYEGLVSDERLNELVGTCLAGIYIPIDEDAGITQCEIMAAGKPVIGVNEGGLKESVIDGETGVLIPANPTTFDLIQAVKSMNPEKALSMKEACIKQASNFDQQIFFEKLDKHLF